MRTNKIGPQNNKFKATIKKANCWCTGFIFEELTVDNKNGTRFICLHFINV